MPKEVTHWCIANEVRGQLPQGAIAKSTNAFPNVYLLGAVFHDCLYYSSDPYILSTKLPDFLHGAHEEDTFSVITSLINMHRSVNDEAGKIILAFLAGVASHIFVDVNFHPFIYHYTGNYYDEDSQKREVATKQHRMIEALLDQHFDANAHSNKTYNLKKIFGEGMADLESAMTSNINFEKHGMSLKIDTVKLAYNNYRLARSIYTKKWLVSLLSIFGKILPKNIKEVLGLSYFNLPYKAPINFSDEFQYKHPVTNTEISTSIKKLTETAIAEGVAFLAIVETVLNVGELNDTGPSLETGLIKSNVKDMKYFSLKA